MAKGSEGPVSSGPRRTWRRRLLSLLRNVVICYLGIILVLMFLENKLIFHPVKAAEEWLAPPNALVQDVEFRLVDGTRLHGWWCPTGDWQPDQGAMLYCHGNAGNLSYRSGLLGRWLTEMHQAVFIFDYPGYGRSEGSPSEAGCYAAADGAYDWLTQVQKVSPERVTLYGGSLGGAVAVDLASRRPHRALILVKTFTSMPDEAQAVYPWLPARWLVRSRFDSLAKIGRCTRPIFIAHGSTDQLIPFRLGQKLFEAANEPKRFCEMVGNDHNDGLTVAFYDELRTFLHRHAEQPVLDQ